MLNSHQLLEMVNAIKQHQNTAISSDPGSGKSTLIPPALMRQGLRVLVLEPRRISAVSLASYVCESQNYTLGHEVGFLVRGQSKKSSSTKCLYITEGLLPKLLQSDPFLGDWDVVIMDEFHERHLQTDMAWSLLAQLQKELRPELKIVILSATLDNNTIKKHWPELKMVHIPSSPYPLRIEYSEHKSKISLDFQHLLKILESATEQTHYSGDVLIFFAGFYEIQRFKTLVLSSSFFKNMDVFELYGSQNLEDQKKALQKSNKRKIILSTNIAESSVTVDGVQIVIDTGFEKVSWANPKSGLSELKQERISLASATQRAGRAARQQPGLCLRLWGANEKLDEFQTAEIHRSDLTEFLYSIFSVGWNPLEETFAWIEKPYEQKITEAIQKLCMLNALVQTPDHKWKTNKSQALDTSTLGLRGSLYIENLKALSNGPLSAKDLLIACLLDEPEARSLSDSRLVANFHSLSRSFKLSSQPPKDLQPLNDHQIDSLLIAAPDRFFERRNLESSKVVLTSTRGALIESDPIHSREPFGFALRIRESDPDAMINEFVAVSKEIYKQAEHKVSQFKKSVPKASTTPRLLEHLLSRKLPTIEAFRHRAHLYKKHSNESFDVENFLFESAQQILIDEPKISEEHFQEKIIRWTLGLLNSKDVKDFEDSCPTHYKGPRTGRLYKLEYQSEDRIEIHARLQEFLGVQTHPKILKGKIPLTLVLLSPAMRPIQITQKLETFWEGSYKEIQKEMKARYPKHEW